MNAVALDVTKFALPLLTSAAGAAPIPALGPVLQIVQQIITIAEAVKKNKDDARGLAAYIRTLTEKIADYLDGREISGEMAEQLILFRR
jgi:hypothetical protein